MFTKDKAIDVNVQGFLLTKSDRINNRIQKLSDIVCKQNTLVEVKEVRKMIKSIQILIAQELTYRGIEEELKNERNNK